MCNIGAAAGAASAASSAASSAGWLSKIGSSLASVGKSLVSGVKDLKAGYSAVKAGTTVANAGKMASVGGALAKSSGALGTILTTAATTGLGLLAQRASSKKYSSTTSRAESALSQEPLNPTEQVAKTATTIKPNSANNLKKTLSTLRIPLSADKKKNTTGINAASMNLGLNLGG